MAYPLTPHRNQQQIMNGAGDNGNGGNAPVSKTPKKFTDRMLPMMADSAKEYIRLDKENLAERPELASALMNGGTSTGTGLANATANYHTYTGSGDSSFSSESFMQIETGKILAYKQKAPLPSNSTSAAEVHRVLYTANTNAMFGAALSSRQKRHIATQPTRVLDAPDLVDDFYVNLLDWSSNNTVAVALGNTVYLWNADSGEIDTLCTKEENITSLQWMVDSSHLAVAVDSDVQLWNVSVKRQVRSLKGHAARVGALAWNSHILSSGSKDNTIFHHDVRIAQHHVGSLLGHTQEICGLKWSPDGTQLASGANDNVCKIWDLPQAGQGQDARFTFVDSQAAVKALAWCPWQRHTIATGGGTADRNIRLYNTQTGAMTNAIDTGSQVCALLWSKTEKELLSAHGFSQNQLSLWKWPSMARTHDLMGHTSRVLHMAMSPDGQNVVSAAADETLRFWKVWEAPIKAKAVNLADHNYTGMLTRNIR